MYTSMYSGVLCTVVCECHWVCGSGKVRFLRRLAPKLRVEECGPRQEARTLQQFTPAQTQNSVRTSFLAHTLPIALL